MDKKQYIWAIIVGIVAVIFNRINNEYKFALPIILLCCCFIVLIYILIWRIKQNINFKKYGSEESVVIEEIMIKNENINNYVKILSNNKVDNCDYEYLIQKFTIPITMKTKTDKLLNDVNELLLFNNFNVSINMDDILKQDYEFIKVRRNNGYTTLRHDLNVIIDILNNHNLEVINITTNNKRNLNMAIIPFDKLDELKELGEINESNQK